jgi:DNA-binding CsgD family transcriptional regulator
MRYERARRHANSDADRVARFWKLGVSSRSSSSSAGVGPRSPLSRDGTELGLELICLTQRLSVMTPSDSMHPEAIAASRERGRASYLRRDWEDVHSALSAVDAAEPLALEDLERLAWSALLTGRDSVFFVAAERIHQAYAAADETSRAARWAFWMGFRATAMGEVARAGAWLSRADRLASSIASECAEHGWLLLPKAYRHTAAQEHQAAHDLAARAAQIGERCGDRDLAAFARNFQGRALVRMSRVEEGLALMDEAMLAAASGELSPLITGLVYCSLIAGCHQVYAFDRAREWTAALSRWCDAQPQLVTFTGTCQVHRAQLLQLGGAWREAIDAARRAAQAPRHANDPTATAEAFYQEAEVHRLRGEYAEAEAAYRSASEFGCDPQPGLALLRLAQGEVNLAGQAVRRALSANTDRMRRVRYLPAYVEIMLAAGDPDAARSGCEELTRIATELGGDVVGAMADDARGSLLLAARDACGALPPLRAALAVWQRLDAPYIVGRVRVLLARACRELGDTDGAVLEQDAARAIFERLGAAPDLAALEANAGGASQSVPSARDKLSASPTQPHKLSPRELEVLRLVAAGKTNKQIGRDLGVSEKTIDRHVSNIFAKLAVSSRTAATAYAYEHGLV